MQHEIEIGEYIRTSNGKIDKVINNNYYINWYIECEKGVIDREMIAKHSKDIIDLIEEGDYVNDGIVTDYYFVGNQKVLVLNNEKISYEENENFVPQLAIKSILTKEQFEQNCYRLEE